MIQQRSRFPAVLMLLMLMAFGSGGFFARRSDAGVDAARLAELQAMVGRPDARVDDWIAYGKALQADKQFENAVAAFNQALKTDQFNTEALLRGAQCRAVLGDAGTLMDFMEATIQVEPKLALSIFDNQSEVRRFMSDPRFKELRDEAFARSLD